MKEDQELKSEKSNSVPSVRLNTLSENGEEVDMDVDQPQIIAQPENEGEEEIIVEHEEELSISDFIKKMFNGIIEDLVERTEEMKELMENLDQRRKKWILWGKNKAKEDNKNIINRKCWNIEKKETNVRKDLENIFQNYEEAVAEGHKNHINFIEEIEPKSKKSSLEAGKVDDIIVPINLAIFQNIHTPIINQSKIINRTCLHLFFRKLELLKHLDNVRKIMF